MENKERFPLSHGTATAIYMNLFTKFVALGLCMYPPPRGSIHRLFAFWLALRMTTRTEITLETPSFPSSYI
jgi:hypothetical protein